MRPRGWVPAGLLAVATAVMTLFAVSVMQESFTSWRTEWAWGWVQWAAQVQLTAPLTGGLAAWVMYDAQRSGRGQWLASLPRGGSVLRWHAASAMFPALATALLTGLVLPLLLTATGPMGWPAALSLAVGCAIVGAGAAGAVIGKLVPRAFTPLVVSILLWALVVGLVPVGSTWLRVAGAGHTLAGYEVNSQLTWQRLVASLLMLGVLLVALSPRSLPRWKPTRQLAFAATALVAVLAITVTGWFSGTYDVRPSAAARASHCQVPAGLEICLMPEHADAAAQVRHSLGAIVEARRQLGIATPARLIELTPYQVEISDGMDSGRDGSQLDFTLGGASVQAVAASAESLVMPSRCHAAFDRVEAGRLQSADEGLRVLSLWAAAVAGQPIAEGRDDPAWLRFGAMSEQAQREWLRQAITRADTCDFARIPELGS